MKTKCNDDIIYKINNAKYVVLNIIGIWSIHIDKNRNEIFQENQYHINRYSDSEYLMKEGTDAIGSLFYIISKSCLTYETFKKWEIYIDDVLIDTNTAYKDTVFKYRIYLENAR